MRRAGTFRPAVISLSDKPPVWTFSQLSILGVGFEIHKFEQCMPSHGLTGLDQCGHCDSSHTSRAHWLLVDYRDCEASCCFSASPSSIRTSNSRHDLTALGRSRTVVVPVIFISGRSLCVSLPLGVPLLISSHPACPSSSVSSWRFDSVTAAERCLQSCGGVLVVVVVVVGCQQEWDVCRGTTDC